MLKDICTYFQPIKYTDSDDDDNKNYNNKTIQSITLTWFEGDGGAAKERKREKNNTIT